MKTSKILLSVAASSLLILGGCGSSSSSSTTLSSTTTSETINGKAIDGYLKYSTICLDLNNDKYCQNNEPYTITDENGSFNLNITQEQMTNNINWKNRNLIVYGGIDSDTGENFDGKVIAPYESNQTMNVTPITTLVASLQDQNLTLDQAKEKVADILDINADELFQDPIKVAQQDNNTTLLEKALSVQKTLEVLAISYSKDQNTTLDNAMNDAIDTFTLGLKDTNTSDVSDLDLSNKIATILEKSKDHASNKDLNLTDDLINSSKVMTLSIEDSLKTTSSENIESKIKFASLNAKNFKNKLQNDIEKDGHIDLNISFDDGFDLNNFYSDNNITKISDTDDAEKEYLRSLISNVNTNNNINITDDMIVDLQNRIKNDGDDIFKTDYKTLKTVLEQTPDQYPTLYQAVSDYNIEAQVQQSHTINNKHNIQNQTTLVDSNETTLNHDMNTIDNNMTFQSNKPDDNNGTMVNEHQSTMQNSTLKDSNETALEMNNEHQNNISDTTFQSNKPEDTNGTMVNEHQQEYNSTSITNSNSNLEKDESTSHNKTTSHQPSTSTNTSLF